ncbi:L,D-transpeptidase family protein [Deminuibacter soli]|nr:L,D-transpeptidase family protein [Deminuibacter soli]
MKRIMFMGMLVLLAMQAISQQSFFDAQRFNPRVALSIRAKEDTLKKQFAAAGLEWPAKQIYVRSFKYDSQLEVWVRNNTSEEFKLFKTYRVCAMAGALGPKRLAGDYQVPEGFYYINQFNAKSNYHLSLGLNYPNASDKILSDSLQPGGDIYIHGSCVTVGCIPIQDAPIEELYILASYAKGAGEDFIPVHIFPIRFNNPKSVQYLEKVAKDDQELQRFAVRLKEVYDYFEKEKRIPAISINKKGEYVVMN